LSQHPQLDYFLESLFKEQGAEGVVESLSFLFGSFVITKDGVVIGANQDFISLIEYDLAELIGMDAMDLITPDERPYLESRFVTNSTDRYELKLLTKSNKIKYTIVSPKVLLVNDDKYRLAEFIDISEQKQALATLQNQEGKYRSVFDFADIGIARVDLGGSWLECNKKLCDIVGYSKEELLQLSFQDITHPDDLALDLTHVRELLANERKTYAMEKRYIHKSGYPIWINLTVSLVRDSNREPMYFISFIEDISEIKITKDKLRFSNEIVSVTTDMLAEVDDNFVYVAANKSYLAAFGLSEAEVLGKTILEVFGEDFYNTTIKVNAEKTKLGETIRYQDWFKFPATGLKFMDITYTPVVVDIDNYKGFVVSARDITALKEAQDVIIKNEEKFRSMFESLPLAIYVSKGIDQVAEFINSTFTKMFGYTIDDVPTVNDWFLKAYPDDDYRQELVEGWQLKVEEAIKLKSSIKQIETYVTCKDGTEKYIRWGYISLEEANYAFGLDITLQKVAEIELLNENEKLEHLSAFDGLTDITNRRMFDLNLKKEWLRAQRNASSLSLIMIDIDFFKAYNDNYGHIKGDECLKLIAETLDKIATRSVDMVARFGGEEFAILLPDTDLQQCRKIAENCRSAIFKLQIPHEYSSVSNVVTISLGVSSSRPKKGVDSLSLIKSADKLLYQAKNNGRNRVEYH